MIMLKKIIKIHKFLLEFSGGAPAPLDESPLLQLAQTFATVSVTYSNRNNLSTSTTVIWYFKCIFLYSGNLTAAYGQLN